MAKYHVEFDVDIHEPFSHDNDEWPVLYSRLECEWALGGTLTLGIPRSATITEIKPEFEAGWYQYYDGTTLNSGVSFWTLDEIESVFNFNRNYRRMNPPTPYEESE